MAASKALVTALETDFALKDLDDLHFFLGIEVNRVSDGLVLTQQRYAMDVVKRANMWNCKPVDTPISVTEKLRLAAGDRLW